MALNINGTTGISGVDGSVSAPAVTGTDSNTGITFPSADTIKFSTGGVERMSITNSGVSGITAGITEADQWRVSSPFDVNGSSFITSNWERIDTAGWDKIGTGMSQSNGIFTFPSTGIYNVIFWTTVRPTNNTTMYAGVEFHFTTDDNNYTNVANFYGGVSTTAFFDNIFGQHLFDISNVSTHKIRFRASAASTTGYSGNTSETQLSATFIKLGDT